jgi:hypothetical protein
MYKINTDIPGWNARPILEILAGYASEISSNGKILELGALFGRTTYALGFNKKEDVELYVIDIWPDLLHKYHRTTHYHDNRCGAKELQMVKDSVSKDIDGIKGDDFFNLWKTFTDGIINKKSFRNYTSLDNTDFPMFDLIVHDAGHEFDDVYNDLTHWFPKLKPEGKLVVDDYDSKNFPGVIKAVDKFVEENNLSVEILPTNRNVLIKRK